MALVVAVAALALPSDLRATDDPLAGALPKGYTVEVASDGTTSARKEAVLRVDRRGRTRADVEVVRYTEGEDKTAEASDRARKEERKHEGEPLVRGTSRLFDYDVR